MEGKRMKVIPIDNKDTYPYLLKIHYAKRIPSISYAFGLFIDGEMKGVCTYGSPASRPLTKGIAGEYWADSVIELNRLVLINNIKNASSYLVSNSIKILPKPKVIVSFADTSMGHIGYVYQASNFFYTGLSAKRKDWKIKGKEHLHGQTIADEFRGKSNRIELIKDKYGDRFYYEERPRKHRYIYFTGSKSESKKFFNDLRYKQLPYPKGDSDNYQVDALKVSYQINLFN